MSHLVQLRQRIAATQITQKTTNAMRLIAMSSHTRLRHIKDIFDAYKNQLNRLLNSIKNSHKKLQEVTTTSPNKPSLVIVIGSQKGLCGNFNTSMAEYFIKNPPHLPTSVTTSYTIIVGKQLKNTLLSRNIVADFSYDQFSSSNYRKIAKELSTILRSGIYSTATIYFTYPQSFFIAKHAQLPLNLDSYNFSSKNSLADEVTSSQFNEQSYAQTYKTLSILSLDANLESILIDSLLAEQAARFLAMDTATRNAEDLINRMKLDYNKLRQAAITRELTDLSGSFIK